MARDTANLEKTAGLGLRESQVVGPRSLPARELVGKDPEDGRGQVGVEGDDPRKLTGHCQDMIGSLGRAFAPHTAGARRPPKQTFQQDPLAIRHVRQHAVDQVGGLIVHPATDVCRVELYFGGDKAASPGDHARPAAGRALEPHEAVSEVAARRDGAKLAKGEARQRALVGVAASVAAMNASRWSRKRP